MKVGQRVKTLSWSVGDVDTPDGKKFEVYAFGQTPDRRKVAINVHDVEPWIHVVLPSEIGEGMLTVAATAIFDQLKKKLEKDDHQPTRYGLSYRLPYYYYTDREEPCMQIFFRTEDAARHCHNLLKYPVYINRTPYKLLAVEDRIDQLTKFHAEYGLKHCVWLELPPGRTEVETSSVHSLQPYEYRISATEIKRLTPEEEASMPPVRPSFLVFDYEAYSKRRFGFPDALNSEDCIFMACLLSAEWNDAINDYDLEEYALVYHKTLKKCDIRDISTSKLKRVSESQYEFVDQHDKIVKMMWFEDEIDLLDAVEDMVVKLNPDVVLGHNSNGFDFPYHKVRKGRFMAPYKNLSRLQNFTPGFESIKWSSSAYKDINLEVPLGPGRLYADTMLIAKRGYAKEDSYGLDAMCQLHMGIGKHDWNPQKIFESFEESDPEKLRNTIVYCLRDVWCTWGLYQHMGYWFSYEGLSDVIGISIFDLFAKGQGARTRPQVFKECYNLGYYLFSPERQTKKIAGGYVWPQVPEHVEYMILLDFEGLYPSIMDYFNISNDTFDFHNRAPDNQVNIFEWDDDFGHWKTRFVKKELRDGIIPQILRNLRAKRKIYKEKMAECKARGDKIGAMIYNSLQDATKVSMNSVYGGLAQAGGYLGLEDGGATVTALGRMLVKKMGDYVVSKGWRVVYGDTDSVMITRLKPLTEDEKINFDKLAAEFLKQLNLDLFKGMAPINVALDGLFRAFLSLAAKMYCFVAWDPKDPLGINPNLWKSKGVASAKRDSCKMNRKLYKTLAVMITCMKPFEEVIMVLIDEINRLLYGKLELEEMITIKQVSAEYAKVNYPMAIYYRHLQEKGLGVKPGDRVPYVLREAPGLKHAGEYYEDPDIFVREGMKFARMEYLKSQFAGRIDNLLHAGFPNLIPAGGDDGPGLLSQIPNYYRVNPKFFKLETAIMTIIQKHAATSGQ